MPRGQRKSLEEKIQAGADQCVEHPHLIRGTGTGRIIRAEEAQGIGGGK